MFHGRRRPGLGRNQPWDAAPTGVGAEPDRQSASHEALDLLFRAAPAHDDAIEIPLRTCFENQRRIFKGEIGASGPVEHGEPLCGNLLNARVHDLIQALALPDIGKDDRAQFLPVDRTI